MGNKNFFLNKDGNLASLLTSSPLCTIESYDETPKGELFQIIEECVEYI